MARAIDEKPLDRFPIIRTDDVDEMREAIGRYYGEVHLSVAGDFDGFRAHGNHCQLNHVGISYASYGAAVDHFYPSLSSSYAVPMAASGAGWGKTGNRSVEINHRQTLIGSPALPGELHVGPEFEELTVQPRCSAGLNACAAEDDHRTTAMVSILSMAFILRPWVANLVPNSDHTTASPGHSH